jgi:transposase-like protein
MDRKSVEVFIPDREECYERLRRALFGATVACLYCGSENVIKKGTTGKDAQKYRCKECDSWFNDLTGTLFENHKFPVEEMFYMLKEMRSVPSAQIASDLERDEEAVLNFVHEVQDLCGEIDEFTLSEVCEADEIYVTAGEKGDEDKDGRERGLSKRGAETSGETNHQS